MSAAAAELVQLELTAELRHVCPVQLINPISSDPERQRPHQELSCGEAKGQGGPVAGLIAVRPRPLLDGQAEGGYAERSVERTSGGETGPEGHAFGIGAPAVRVDYSFHQPPHGIADQSGRHDDERDAAESDMVHDSERTLSIYCSSAPTEAGLSRHQSHGDVQHRLCCVTHPG